jgi:hypothetical protein
VFPQPPMVVVWKPETLCPHLCVLKYCALQTWMAVVPKHTSAHTIYWKCSEGSYSSFKTRLLSSRKPPFQGTSPLLDLYFTFLNPPSPHWPCVSTPWHVAATQD